MTSGVFQVQKNAFHLNFIRKNFEQDQKTFVHTKKKGLLPQWILMHNFKLYRIFFQLGKISRLCLNMKKCIPPELNVSQLLARSENLF